MHRLNMTLGIIECLYEKQYIQSFSSHSKLRMDAYTCRKVTQLPLFLLNGGQLLRRFYLIFIQHISQRAHDVKMTSIQCHLAPNAYWEVCFLKFIIHSQQNNVILCYKKTTTGNDHFSSYSIALNCMLCLT